VPHEIDDDSFWQEFRRRVKNANPEAYIVGEIWTPAQRWLEGDQFDAVMNYVLTQPLMSFFGARTLAPLWHGGTYPPAKPMNAPEFAQAVESALSLYDWEITSAQMNLLGSHDTPRFVNMVGGDRSALRLAMLCMMTLPGAPTIYYGDEIGLSGGYEPESRGGMPWDRSQWDVELLGYIRGAIQLRNAHAALRRGTYRTLLAEGEQLAYARELDGERLIVAFNAAADPQTLHVPLAGGGSPRVLFGEVQEITRQDAVVSINALSRSGVVIALQN
jgi:cyclomaltodextrinase